MENLKNLSLNQLYEKRSEQDAQIADCERQIRELEAEFERKRQGVKCKKLAKLEQETMVQKIVIKSNKKFYRSRQREIEKEIEEREAKGETLVFEFNLTN